MDPEIKHTSRQYEHVVPAAQRSEQEKRWWLYRLRDRGSVVSFYAEMPCSLSKLDLGLC